MGKRKRGLCVSWWFGLPCLLLFFSFFFFFFLFFFFFFGCGSVFTQMCSLSLVLKIFFFLKTPPPSCFIKQIMEHKRKKIKLVDESAKSPPVIPSQHPNQLAHRVERKSEKGRVPLTRAMKNCVLLKEPNSFALDHSATAPENIPQQITK